MTVKKKKILAISSGGGHWMQLKRIIPAFEGHNVVFVTVNKFYKSKVGSAKFYTVNDSTIWDKFGLMKTAIQIFYILLCEGPDVVISTGASPGYFGIVFGKLFGAKTIWLDSIANVKQLSLSGRLVERFADLWLTQWPNLAKPKGPYYRGKVI